MAAGLVADWSEQGIDVSALQHEGVTGAARYLAPITATDQRGIGSDELSRLIAANVDFLAICEWTADRMLAGNGAGKYDADNAHRYLESIGGSPYQPIFFTQDFDATPDEQNAIDDYLRGCASIIGSDRVGLYGDFYVLERSRANGTASWFWQTSAWSGGQVDSFIHLYQHTYNVPIGGVECDLSDVYQNVYGQWSAFKKPVKPVPVPIPDFPKPEFPTEYAKADARFSPSQFADEHGRRYWPLRANAVALRDTVPHVRPEDGSDASGKHIPEGAKIGLRWEMFDDEKHKWYVNAAGYWRASAFTPDYPVPVQRKRRNQ